MLAALLVTMNAVPDPQPSLSSVEWMVGHWSCEVWGGVFEETWSPASGGTMLGHGKLIKDGKSTFEEHMSMRELEGKVVMWIHSGSLGEKPIASVPFTLTRVSADAAWFENPSHDFPKQITYRRQGEGRMLCLIQGIQGGKATETRFEFKRVPSGSGISAGLQH